MVNVEVQFRTIAMDFWASLEHKVRYKKNVPASEVEQLAKELTECATISAELDNRMQNIRNRLMEAAAREEEREKEREQNELERLYGAMNPFRITGSR